MSATHSNALVFFGATGDLAYKKIFPSLQTMIRRDNLIRSANTHPAPGPALGDPHVVPPGGWHDPRAA